MHTLSDETGAVKNIQEKLQAIGEGEKIVTNGIIDEKTRMAIYEFQKSKMLPQTGVVDKETFYALIGSYRSAIIKNDAPSDIPFPIGRSDNGHYMATVNSALKTVYEYYFGASDLTSSQFFSSNTENVVKVLQRVFMTEESGKIDAYFYKRLMSEVDSIKKLSFFKV